MMRFCSRPEQTTRGMTDVERDEEMNCVYWSESMRTVWQSVEDRKMFVLMMTREEIINEDKDIASGLLKGGKDKRNAVTRSLYCKQREEVEIEEVLKKLQELSKLVRTNAVTLTQVLKSDEEPLELNNRTITKGIRCKVSRKESFIDTVAREGTELKAVLKELEISRFKRVACKDDMARRSQAKRTMARKTPGTMEEKLLTPKLNTPFNLVRLIEMPDGPVDLATVTSTIVRNLAKRKAIERGPASHSVTSDSIDDSSMRRKVTSPTKSQVVLEESDKIAEGADLRPCFEVGAGLLEEQCRAKAREKMVAIVVDEFKKFAHALRGVQLGLQDRSIELEKKIFQLKGEKNQFEENLTREREAFQLGQEKEWEAAALKLKEVRAKSLAEAEQLVTASATSRNNLAGKLYKLKYSKAEILAFSEGNY
ncbi:hypothetical protein GIB67_022221 [Kingdonia uniflora]|uniref:Uncharacterized protein n=1 Tax=Kingdonia uniflora TaxID=39325 RepID=A0A7J7M6V0_9MAGN|nr:hypothetical protein GIB67_022221 [Kingdonia uniflora]